MRLSRVEALFAIISLGTTVGMAARLLLPPLLPFIIDDLAISPFLAGISISLSWGLYAVFHYPGGRLSDALSTRTVLVGSLLASILGVFVLLVTRTYPLFLLAVALIGVGTGMYLPATYSWVTETFPDQLGSRFGIVSASINLGGALASGLTVVVLSLTTWRLTFLPVAMTLILVLGMTQKQPGVVRTLCCSAPHRRDVATTRRQHPHPMGSLTSTKSTTTWVKSWTRPSTSS